MYVKLFSKILDSSIWLENDSTVRVWITMLASMDRDGFCAFASVENLARRARVKPCHTAKAIEVLESPDPKSANDAYEGRRIEQVQGGWVVLNAKKYREITRSGELRTTTKPSQVVSTRFISSQVVLPIEVTTNEINKSVPDAEAEADITPTTKRKRKKFTFQGYTDGTEEVFNHFAPIWPDKRGNGSVVVFSKAQFADRISKILHDGFTVQQLIAAGDTYLSEKPDWPSCPQFFFGKGDDAKYLSYVRMHAYEQSKQVTQ